MYTYMISKNQIAAAITANWESSGAKTIAQEDIQSLQETAPEFGVLCETGGKKLYAFLEGGDIKKLVIPEYSGILQNKEVIKSITDAGFTLRNLRRR
jgi:hypothetical protein